MGDASPMSPMHAVRCARTTAYCCAIVILSSTTAAVCGDFDGQKVASVYSDVRPACRQAELDGQPISKAESDRFCIILDAFGFQLKANGYCWDASEVEWRLCAKK
jgi:hypothetical protein